MDLLVAAVGGLRGSVSSMGAESRWMGRLAGHACVHPDCCCCLLLPPAPTSAYVIRGPDRDPVVWIEIEIELKRQSETMQGGRADRSLDSARGLIDGPASVEAGARLACGGEGCI